MYKMELTDGTEVEFTGVNGNNFIVPDQKEMDTTIFTDENLKTGKVIDDDGNEYPFENLSFTQQQKQQNGDYYICFHEIPEGDTDVEEIRDLIIKIAEIEVMAGNLELEDINGSLQDAVRVKLDDDKWIDK